MVDILRVKRRAVGGAAGGPAIGTIAAAEIAFNEQDNTLYYGKGNSAGLATSVIAIAGPGAFAPLASPVFTGDPRAPTPLVTDNDTSLATTAFVQSVVSSNGVQTYNGRSGAVVPLAADITAAGGALLVSPVFTGNPTSTATIATTDNTGSLATTAWVKALGYATTASLSLPSITNPLPNGTVAIGSATTRYALADHVHPTDGTRAPINNPTFTGTVTLPTTTVGTTQALGDEDTSMATTAFVARGAGGYLPVALNPADTDQTWTSAQMGARVINVIGAITADRTITVPMTGQQKSWLVRNGTTGGFDITVSNGTAGFTIPPGFTGEFWSSGTALFPSQNILLGPTVHIGDVTRNALVVTTGLTAAATTITTSGTGVLTFGDGVGFGSALAPGGNTDLSRHLALYSTTYGLNVTSGRFNYVAGGSHVFLAGGTDRVTIGTTGLTMTTGNSITLPDLPTVGTSAVNKTYVDSRVSPVIATIAALRLTTTTTLTAVVCTVQNYAATSTGSNGGGQFMYVASDTTSADDNGTIIVDASSRRWYRVAADGRWLNVMWFGAVGNGLANDGPAIQAAINSVQAGGGGTVYLPEGVYAHSATLLISQSGVSLVGAGYDATHDFAGSWTNTDNTRPVTALLWTGANLGVQVQVMPTGSGTVWNDNGAGLGGCAVLNMCLFAGTTPYTVAASVGVMGKCIKDCEFSFFALEHKTAGLLLGTINRTPAFWNNSAAFNRIPFLGYRGVAAGAGGAVRLENTGVSTDQGNAYNNLFGLVDVRHNNGHAIDLASCDNNVFQMVRIQRVSGGTGVGVYFRSGTFGNGMARANVFNLLSPGAGGAYAESSVVTGGVAAPVTFPSYENKIMWYNSDEDGAPGYPAIGTGISSSTGANVGGVIIGPGVPTSSTLWYSRTKESGASYFTITMGGAQSIPNSTDVGAPNGGWAILQLNTVEEDPAFWYDTTNFRWIPRYPGRWLITASVELQVNAVAGTRQIQLVKNANIGIARSIAIIRGTGIESISVSGAVQFNGCGDYLAVEVWQDSGAAATVVYDSFSTNVTYIAGSRAA